MMLKGLDVTKITLLWNWNGIKEFGIIIKRKEASITNPAFKLVKNFSFYLFTLAWVLACLRLWWGSLGSIYCKRPCDGCSDDHRVDYVVSHYCWMMSTYTFPDVYPDTPGIPGIGVPPKHNAGMKYTAFYPWVPYVLFLQSLLMVVPFKVWSYLEGKRMEYFNKSVFVEREKGDKDEEKDKEYTIKLRKLATVLLSHQKYGLNVWYSAYYVFGEILNLSTVVFNLWFTDIFLSGEFGTIGFDIISRMMSEETRTDVLAFTFPKVTKCLFRRHGHSGTLEEKDYMCVLPINEAYEKIYIIIWFWLWAVCLTSTLALLYRFALIISPGFRRYILSRPMAVQDRKLLPDILKGLGYCDWFMLKLMSDNSSMIGFGNLCAAIRDEMLDVKIANVEVTVEVEIETTPVKKFGPVKRCSDYISARY